MFRRLQVRATLTTGLLAVIASCGQLPGRALASPGSAPRPVTAAWLNGVTATSDANAWAVGAFVHAGGAAELIERWNGRRWKVTLKGLNAPQNFDSLTGVAATSATSAWAAGTISSQYSFSLIDRWGGTGWGRQATPVLGGDGGASFLTGVAAASRTSAWAVGGYQGGPPGLALLTLILRWNDNKNTWIQVPSPSPAGNGSGAASVLNGVAARSRTDAWAVGAANSGPSGQENTVIEHWDGALWTVVPSPDPARYPHHVTKLLIERWDGTRWTVVPVPNPTP